MKNADTEQLERELSEIANAVHSAGLLTSLHRQQCEALAQTTGKLEASLERAIKALMRLQHSGLPTSGPR